MGEGHKEAFGLGFDNRLELEFHGPKVSTDGGLGPHYELYDGAQLTESGAAKLCDFRTGRNICHSMSALLRQLVHSRLPGYEGTNDAERLSIDPAIRHVVGGRAADRAATSTSLVGRFETAVLTHPNNLAALIALCGERRTPKDTEPRSTCGCGDACSQACRSGMAPSSTSERGVLARRAPTRRRNERFRQ